MNQIINIEQKNSVKRMTFKYFEKDIVDDTVNELVWYINKFDKFWKIEELDAEDLYFLMVNYPRNKKEDQKLVKQLQGTVWEKIIKSDVRFKPETVKSFTKEESPIRYTISTLERYGRAAKKVLGNRKDFLEEFGLSPEQFIKFVIDFKQPGKNLMKADLFKALEEFTQEEVREIINSKHLEKVDLKDIYSIVDF